MWSGALVSREPHILMEGVNVHAGLSSLRIIIA